MIKSFFLFLSKSIGIALSIISFTSCLADNTKHILIIGDSNGAASNGWVTQLKKLHSDDSICNLSIAGNTIGFYNNGLDTLNSLHNMDSYLQRGELALGKITHIIILLGTNDCKAMFDSVQHLVPDNLDVLLGTVKKFEKFQRIEKLYVSPPPIADDSLLETKYHGAEDRLLKLLPKMEAVAIKNGFSFINLHDSIIGEFPQMHTDGIHLNEEGAQRIAQVINQYLEKP